MLHHGYDHIVLCCLVLFKVIIAGEVGEECAPTEEISRGTCKLLTDCKNAISFIQAIDFHPFSRCGFIDKVEIVCCPHKYIQPPTSTKRRRPNTGAMGQEKYGSGDRIADRECQKIVDSTLPSLESHITGGTNASLGEFTHMVTLGYNITGVYEFRCGGSLISDSYVLTAAHCVDTLDSIKPAIARMGVIYLGDGEWNNDSDVRIQQIIKHPHHVRRLKYNDIALLKLEQSVVFTPSLNPICLYTKNEDPSVPLIITGWGRTNTTRNVRNPYLQKATVVVVSKSKCEEAHPSWRKLPQGISDEQICAGDPKGLRDTCQGDSGGPLMGLTTNDGFLRLVGVTSYGRGCGSPVPGVYTRVSRYLDWIESVVWSN
ncbi:trypsin-1-like [Maniola jurtina]|uniref:trypsin-1-like n=1 Tax=Maniola jurtina TaxID=191418 RepID=UPI001E6872CA|nr:trypsin-1-like [Maniola jurtina]